MKTKPPFPNIGAVLYDATSRSAIAAATFLVGQQMDRHRLSTRVFGLDPARDSIPAQLGNLLGKIDDETEIALVVPRISPTAPFIPGLCRTLSGRPVTVVSEPGTSWINPEILATSDWKDFLAGARLSAEEPNDAVLFRMAGGIPDVDRGAYLALRAMYHNDAGDSAATQIHWDGRAGIAFGKLYQVLAQLNHPAAATEAVLTFSMASHPGGKIVQVIRHYNTINHAPCDIGLLRSIGLYCRTKLDPEERLTGDLTTAILRSQGIQFLLDTRDYDRWELFQGVGDLRLEAIAEHLRDALKFQTTVNLGRVLISNPPGSTLFDNVPYKEVADTLADLLLRAAEHYTI